MLACLRAGFEAEQSCRGNKNSIAALRRRDLIDDNNALTPEGRFVVLEGLSLDDQCRSLQLLIEHADVKTIKFPERVAFNLFKKDGYVGAWCEGGAILTLLKALCLQRLARYNTFGSRDDACTRFLCAQLVILKERHTDVLKSFDETTEARLVTNFDEIYSHQDVREYYPGLSSTLMTELYRSLPTTALTKLMHLLMREPYDYGRGWPDLTLVRGKEVRFVEVKTTDKLHKSQLITIPAIRDVLPATFSILQLRTKDRNNPVRRAVAHLSTDAGGAVECPKNVGRCPQNTLADARTETHVTP